MPHNIVVHVDDLVKAAEREIETLDVADAIKLSGRDDVVFVDLRDIRELARAAGCPAHSTARAACWNSGSTP
jgi:hypothetical protein